YKTKTVAELPDEIKEEIFRLFEDENLAKDFPILTQLQEEVLNQLPDIKITDYTGKEYVPSAFAETVFADNFLNYISSKALFGYTFEDVLNKIIKKGQANFD